MFKRFLPLALAAFLLGAGPAIAAETGSLFSADTPTPDTVHPKISAFEEGIQIDGKWPTTVTLARVNVKDRQLDQSYVTYSADMQGVNLLGKAYLEMWLHFAGKGFFFSRGLDQALTKDGGWQTYTTPFILKPGEQPDEIVLNVRFDGAGILRVRNVKLDYLRGEAEKKAEEKTGQKQPEAKEKEGKE